MNTESAFNLTIFTDVTKKICLCSFASMTLIILFIISPLSNFFKTSLFMKIVSVVILGYTIYLNFIQTNLLRNVTMNNSTSPDVKSQINMNIICSYIFSLFLVMLLFFVMKSFF
jgi:hypothetical protein